MIARSIGRARGLLLGLGALLCAFQFLLVVIAGEIQRSQTFAQLTALIPAMFQQVAGGLFFASFGGLVSLGFVHPAIVLILVQAAIFLASEPAWEVEAGIVDLTLARPVPRRLVITRTLLVVFGATGGVVLLMIASMQVALYALAPVDAVWPRLRTAALLGMNLTAVTWWFAALSLLIATIVRRRSAALGIAALSAVFLYLLHLIAEIWGPAHRFRLLAPFHYYNSPALIRGATDEWSADMAVLLITAAILCAAAYRAYSRRDL